MDFNNITIEEWLNGSELGIDIWKHKYQYEDEDFNTWLDRISNGNHSLKRLIQEKKFLFGGRILSNRGLHNKGLNVTYSNCYVVAQPEDNIESIFECASKLARTFSYGGGCGIDISNLSPRGARVRNTARHTTGSVSFMDLYSLVTELIGQNGRRGALMISIDCHHPDLEEFITVKSDLDRVTKANISIRVTRDFLTAVKEDKDFLLTFTRETTGEVINKTVKAHDLFYKFCEMNHDYAEPAFLFWDRIEEYNLLSNTKEFKYAGTNPCAEEPLPAGGSCLLGSLNLSEFVLNEFTDGAYFDLQSFNEATREAVTALNEVLDEGLPLHPLQEQRDSVRDWRQIGLGVMGIADMLIKLKIPYGSKSSVSLCDNISFSMANNALYQSAVLAKEHGAFPKCNISEIISTEFIANNTSEDTRNMILNHGLRNSQILTIAPTGSTSTMIGVSGGIEPIFANFYTRKTESLHGEDVSYRVYTPIVRKYLDTIEGEELPEFFVESKDLSVKQRVDMQSAWQNHIDASISSTVNLPNEATVQDVEDLYMYAWEKGLKGITVYRSGCKREGILTTSDDTAIAEPETPKVLQRGDIISASDDTIGLKRKLTTGCGSLHCSAHFDRTDGSLREMYLSKGSTGGCNNFMIGLSRMISLAARAGCNINQIVDQLNSCGACPSYATRTATKHDTSKGACCPTAIGFALKDMYNEMQWILSLIHYDEPDKEVVMENYEVCPDCGEKTLVFEGGCNTCIACGYSKCN